LPPPPPPHRPRPPPPGIGGTAAGGGALGYCRSYSFNAGDLSTCGDVVLNYVEGKAAVPWQDLRYLLCEVFYGALAGGGGAACSADLVQGGLLAGGRAVK
jgi:hypothetical protein